MEISKTKIEKRLRAKRNPLLVETIIKLKKTNPVVAKELAKPKREWTEVNLDNLNDIKGDVVVAGKVLSSGELKGKKKIVAWAISGKALEKIKNVGGEFVSVYEEVSKNPELKNLEIVK